MQGHFACATLRGDEFLTHIRAAATCIAGIFGAKSVDLPPLDRLAHRLRRLVRASVTARILRTKHIFPGMGGGVLFSGAAL